MNRVVHFEIHADDVERAKKFYQSVFNWKMDQMGEEFGNYVVITTGPGMTDAPDPKNSGINGGMMKRRGPRPANDAPVSAYTCIIGVDNIDNYIKKVEKAGGTLALAKMDVPGVGLLAYYHDTEGNLFGMLQPAPRQ